MKKNILFILITVLIVISCRKDEISDGPINQPPVPEVIYQMDLKGSIVDQSGQPLANVQISSGQNNALTDIHGLFRIDDLSVDGIFGAYISAEAEGYFSGGDRLYTQGTHSRQMQITLIKKELAGYVNSNENESVSLQNGLKIDFPAGGFTSNGSDYDGLVLVYAHHIDPSEEGYLERSPGDLSGTDELNNSYMLESFGMIAVEMETADGHPVQLKEGSFSTITVPVDESLLDDAPAELPLWHFDEDLHKWIKEGMAELVNGSYVGQVPHFSWWNCDDFIISAGLCIQLVNPRFDGNMQGLTVKLTTQAQGSSTGITDSEGYVNGLIPANEIIEVIIYDLCGNIVFTGTIGPFTGNENKEVIPVILGALELYEFSGTVFDCEAMEFVVDAIVVIEVGDNTYYTETNENGIYTNSILACSENEEYVVTAFDVIGGSSGLVTGIASLDEINVVDINLCNESQFFIINGELLGDLEVIAKRKPNETIIVSDPNGTGYAIGFYGFTVGTYPAFYNGGQYNSTNCTVTITQFDDLGGVIKGAIQGEDENGGGVINGSFVAFVVE